MYYDGIYKEEFKIYTASHRDILRLDHIRLNNNIVIASPWYDKSKVRPGDYTIEISEKASTLYDFKSDAIQFYTSADLGDPLISQISFIMKKEKNDHNESYIDTIVEIVYEVKDAVDKHGINEMILTFVDEDGSNEMNILFTTNTDE